MYPYGKVYETAVRWKGFGGGNVEAYIQVSLIQSTNSNPRYEGEQVDDDIGKEACA